jgi:hypothetical protein
MPQARRAGSSPSNPSAPKTTSARAAAPKSAASKPAAAKRAAAKPAARKSTTAKPAASRTAAKPAASKSAAAKPTARKSAAAKPAASKSTAAKRPAAKATASKTAAAKSAAAKSAPRVSIRVNAENVQLDQIAERLRKLNEKIIEFGRDTGDNTLTSYEKALKTIASNVQQSAAKDELEWITNLVASQAKFVREITDSWAKAARERLK